VPPSRGACLSGDGPELASFAFGATPARCLTMMNGMMERLSNGKWRGLLGRYIFGLTETE
jgi:hypothetical protein